MEDKSFDTVGNALNSIEIIARMPVTWGGVLLVTSASHVRRAMGFPGDAALIRYSRL